jgi:hypothetical protein
MHYYRSSWRGLDRVHKMHYYRSSWQRHRQVPVFVESKWPLPEMAFPFLVNKMTWNSIPLESTDWPTQKTAARYSISWWIVVLVLPPQLSTTPHTKRMWKAVAYSTWDSWCNQNHSIGCWRQPSLTHSLWPSKMINRRLSLAFSSFHSYEFRLCSKKKKRTYGMLWVCSNFDRVKTTCIVEFVVIGLSNYPKGSSRSG